MKLVFANQLRGVAALCVAVSHLVGFFWLMQDFLALATMSPQQGGAPPAWPLWLVTHRWFNFGPFGVGLFFLISGLVIPFSLERHSRLGFLAARALRIYPTYLAALIAETALLYAASLYWHRPFVYGWATIAANATLLHPYLVLPSVDMVNWTLGIELKFYVVMAAIAPRVRAGSVAALLGVSCAVLASVLVLARWGAGLGAGLGAAADAFTLEATYVPFMLVGVLFNYRLRGLLRMPAFLGSGAVLLAIFVVAWRASSIAAQVPEATVNYFTALALFATLFALRRHARPVPLLDWLAGVSYPFYLLHAVLGYSAMKLLMVSGGLPYGAALAVAVGATLGIAWVLHVAVERPTMELGRRLGESSPGGSVTRRLPRGPVRTAARPPA